MTAVLVAVGIVLARHLDGLPLELVEAGVNTIGWYLAPVLLNRVLWLHIVDVLGPHLLLRGDLVRFRVLLLWLHLGS